MVETIRGPFYKYFFCCMEDESHQLGSRERLFVARPTETSPPRDNKRGIVGSDIGFPRQHHPSDRQRCCMHTVGVVEGNRPGTHDRPGPETWCGTKTWFDVRVRLSTRGGGCKTGSFSLFKRFAKKETKETTTKSFSIAL